MKNIFKTLTLIFLGILFGACSSKEPNLQTVQKVQLDKYLGTWYEIARYEHFFEKDCKNVSANYSMLDEPLSQSSRVKAWSHLARAHDSKVKTDPRRTTIFTTCA